MIFRDLEMVRSAIKEATDLDITYAYDDLVFPEHVAFLIQYAPDSDKKMFCFFHVDCFPQSKREIFEQLTVSFQKRGCELSDKGSFSLAQKGEEFEIRFS
ncbi:MAG TPA: hypothetical protein PLG33_06055 [Prolixibacteraceae bacterium]|nr:hypothetical protein [Prolixibacteraceae bacterium]